MMKKSYCWSILFCVMFLAIGASLTAQAGSYKDAGRKTNTKTYANTNTNTYTNTNTNTRTFTDPSRR